MALNLLKLPFLVRDEIFKSMDYNELFLLSLTSTQAKSFIALTTFNIVKLRYRCYENEVSVQIYLGNRMYKTIASVIKENESDGRDYSTVKVGDGLKVLMRFHRVNAILLTIRAPVIDNELHKALQIHINAVFNYRGPNVLESNLRTWASTKLQNVTGTLLSTKEIDVSSLETHLTRNPNHQCLTAFGNFVGELPEYSKVHKVPSLRLRCIGGLGPLESSSSLKFFQGQHLHLAGANVSVKQMRQFFEKWISGEGYNDLKSLWIDFMEPNWFRLEGFEFLMFDEMNPEKWPQRVFYNPELIGFVPFSIDLWRNGFVEIKRKTDGKKAFVSCGLERIRCFVMGDN